VSELKYKTWAPTKPADDYNDDEIRETPLFDKIRENFAVAGSSGEVSLPESSILTLAREAIKEMWATLQVTQFSDVILEVFDTLERAGVEHGNEITIKLNDKNPERRIGSYDKPKGKGRKRFGHSHYAEFIGQGTPKDSPLYRECVTALREKCNLDENALHGGYLLLKTQMRSEMRNGVFELVLEKGREANGVTDVVTAKLYQYPFVEQAVQVITFPPISGKKDDLRQTDAIKEVPSMSQMLKQSILESAMTPAVMFGLVELLKAGGNTLSGKENTEDDASQDDTGPISAKPAPVAAPAPVSAAHSLLDDDDEE
jgi:hypothetical protein